MARPKQPQLSVVLATYNEAATIERCLGSVVNLGGEIIVVDGHSTDETVRLSRKLGARVIETTNKTMFHINKQMAIDEARGKWILQLDADEVVDPELKKSLVTIIKEGTAYAAFKLNRKNYFLGKFLTKGGQYPDPVIRFFKRGSAFLPMQDVHEQMTVRGEVGTISGHLLHYNAPTFFRYIENANRYTSFRAHQLLDQGVKLSIINDIRYLIWRPTGIFFNIYLRHRGYVDGFPGFVFALFSGLHPAIAYMKLGDLYRLKER